MPVAAAMPGVTVADGPPLQTLVDPHEILDARLAELAGLALTAIERQLASGVDLAAAVLDVLGRLLGPDDPPHEVRDSPQSAPTADVRVRALVSDPAHLARLVQAIRDILGRSLAGHG
jgi:hypothetical protein